MFCNKCGTELNDGVVFCSKCGAKIDQSTYSSVISNDVVNDNRYSKYKALIIALVISISFCILGWTLFFSSIINSNSNSKNESNLISVSDLWNTHTLNGVYTKSGYEHRAGWTGDIQDYRKYCVEFSEDGTAVWWENAIYGSSQYYIGSYSYNKDNDYYILKLDDYSTKSIIVYYDEDYITIKGGRFDNVVFAKGDYKDISEAVQDRD